MDMAEGWTGAPDYTLDEKTLGPVSIRHRGLCSI